MQSELKLVTLNIWGGHVEVPLLNFIKANQNIDIFCLQEVYKNAPAKITDESRYINLDIFSDIQAVLPNHQGYFKPVVNGIYGIAMFIKKNLEVVEEGEYDIYFNEHYAGIGPAHSRILHYAKILNQDTIFTVINVHGLWNGQGKTDTADRINQSNKIKYFLNTIDEPKILCGDFNLRQDTESLKMLEQDLENHIKKHDIQSTRTSYYPGAERSADYIMTSKDIRVKRFQVLPDEVSDHNPLMIDFSINAVA